MFNIVNSNKGNIQIRKKTHNWKPTSNLHRVNSCKSCLFYAGRVSYRHRVNGVSVFARPVARIYVTRARCNVIEYLEAIVVFAKSDAAM